MSDELLEKLGNDFVDNDIRELTGIEFRHFIEDPNYHMERVLMLRKFLRLCV